jgi:hypothetical protein
MLAMTSDEKVRIIRDPLVAYTIIFFLCLFGAYITFGILSSTGFVKDERIQLGGAAAGFFAFFTLVSWRYSSEMKKVREAEASRDKRDLEGKTLTPRLSVIFKENSNRSDNVQLNLSECCYRLRRYEGVKKVEHEPDIPIEPIRNNGELGGYYIKLPIEIQKDMLIDFTLSQQNGEDGRKWKGIWDPGEYILEVTP